MTSRYRLLLVLVCLMSSSPLQGHDVGAEVRLQKGHLQVSVFYDDGTWARRAHIELFRADTHERVAHSRTDDQGCAWFPVPSPGKYLLRVNAGAGHIHEQVISVASGAINDTSLSSGPSYEERTSFPWLKLSLGLVILTLLALAAWWTLKQGCTGSRPDFRR